MHSCCGLGLFPWLNRALRGCGSRGVCRRGVVEQVIRNELLFLLFLLLFFLNCIIAIWIRNNKRKPLQEQSRIPWMLMVICSGLGGILSAFLVLKLLAYLYLK